MENPPITTSGMLTLQPLTPSHQTTSEHKVLPLSQLIILEYPELALKLEEMRQSDEPPNQAILTVSSASQQNPEETNETTHLLGGCGAPNESPCGSSSSRNRSNQIESENPPANNNQALSHGGPHANKALDQTSTKPLILPNTIEKRSEALERLRVSAEVPAMVGTAELYLNRFGNYPAAAEWGIGIGTGWGLIRFILGIPLTDWAAQAMQKAKTNLNAAEANLVAADKALKRQTELERAEKEASSAKTVLRDAEAVEADMGDAPDVHEAAPKNRAAAEFDLQKAEQAKKSAERKSAEAKKNFGRQLSDMLFGFFFAGTGVIRVIGIELVKSLYTVGDILGKVGLLAVGVLAPVLGAVSVFSTWRNAKEGLKHRAIGAKAKKLMKAHRSDPVLKAFAGYTYNQQNAIGKLISVIGGVIGGGAWGLTIGSVILGPAVLGGTTIAVTVGVVTLAATPVGWAFGLFGSVVAIGSLIYFVSRRVYQYYQCKRWENALQHPESLSPKSAEYKSAKKWFDRLADGRIDQRDRAEAFLKALSFNSDDIKDFRKPAKRSARAGEAVSDTETETKIKLILAKIAEYKLTKWDPSKKRLSS